MKKNLRTLVALPVAALTLAACDASSTTATDTNSAGTANASGSFDKTDVSFAQDMIPHHQQAVQMARLAMDRASSTRVKTLAPQIEAAQGPEIKTMTGWLKAWGQKTPSSDTRGMQGMGGSRMPGMMNSHDMQRLGKASGTSFDRMFLTMMVSHHDGAIKMARTEQADGKNAEAVALAKRIEADQTSQIATMKQLLQG
ncbi:MAG: DUF305 domain-containing protein [Marmoricola sp.]